MQFRLKSLTGVAVLLLAVTGLECAVATAEAASQPAVGSTVVDATGKKVGTVVDADTLSMKIGKTYVLVRSNRNNIYGVYSNNGLYRGVRLNFTQANCKGTAYYSVVKFKQFASVVLDDPDDWTAGKMYYAEVLKPTKIKSYKYIGVYFGDETCENYDFTEYAGPAKTLKYSFKPPFNVK